MGIQTSDPNPISLSPSLGEIEDSTAVSLLALQGVLYSEGYPARYNVNPQRRDLSWISTACGGGIMELPCVYCLLHVSFSPNHSYYFVFITVFLLVFVLLVLVFGVISHTLWY